MAVGGGGGGLPLNSALASALALHGVNAGSNTNAVGAGTSGRTKTSVHALATHPSLPRVAYLAQESSLPPPVAPSPSNKKKSAASAIQRPTTIVSQKLVVQQYNRNGGSNGKNNGAILASLPMEKLPSKINAFRRPRSKSSKLTNQPLTLASLGQLESITFLDREALYWQTRRHHGSLSNLEAGGAALVHGEGVVLAPDTNLNCVDGIMGRGLCLGLQFSSILVVLRFDDAASEGVTILCCLEGQRQSNGKELGKVQYTPSSAMVPITNSVLVYGCSDGAMRYHNLVPSMLYSSSNTDPEAGSGKSTKQIRQATIKSVRGPNGRNDPVVKILNVDPVYNEDRARDTPLGVPSQVGNVPTTESIEHTLLLRSRLLTVCASGVAFLWDVHVHIDRASGVLRDLNVLPPLVRLDGLGSLTLSPRKPPASNPQARTGGFWGRAAASRAKDGSTEAPYARVAPSVSYDPHRHLLFWTLPSDAPVSSVDYRADYELESLAAGSALAKKESEDGAFLGQWAEGNGGFVKVWDLGLVDGLIRSSASSSSVPRPPPKMPPVTIAKLPTSVASADDSPLGMVAGLCHTPISASSLACVSLSRDGSKLIVHAAPFHGAYDMYDEDEGAPSSATGSPVKSKNKKLNARAAQPKIMFARYSARHTVPLDSGSLSPHAIGSSVAASHFAPDHVAVATDRGVLVANLAHGEAWASEWNPLDDPGSSNLSKIARREEESDAKTPPARVPAGPIHAAISTGGVGNRLGVVFVENNAVYASRLGSTRASSIERVDLPDPTILCKLHAKKAPWTTSRSTRMSNFVESFQTTMCPPRLISSPSGRYLCLYWEDRKRYEIVHSSSMLAREQSAAGLPNASDGTGQHVTPSVDSGNLVLSFAWIGDDDNFAILRQPAELLPEEHSVGEDPTRTDLPSMRKPAKPQVELFKLAEVQADAVELAAGGSIAAATTVSLGTLAVRGGDRVAPSVIFGGPSLCVGGFSMSDSGEPGEGIAYFYSRKSGALEANDERAASYGTVGTSIPYPDLVAWDEDGLLCAVACGSRVVIYLSEKLQFVLLGSVQVTGRECSDSGSSLLSLEFIHGVLFCSTQSSVHAIFLGDLEGEDSVCEIDAFTIAADDVPMYGMDNPDASSPVPAIAALRQPHILAYHSGGLLVSTTFGLRLLPLSHPFIRIGTLLAANLTERARKWILAMPKSEHDNLAHFLIRRGHADMAIRDLNGLSLETYIDLLMRYRRTDELERLIDTHVVQLVPEICDWGRGINEGYSAYLAIGLYLVGKERIECAKKLAAQAVESGVTELLVDALNLSRYIAAVDKSGDGSALMQQVVNAMDFHGDGQLPFVHVVN